MNIYSATYAAKLIGCDPATIRRHCLARNIGTRLGRDWALTESDLDALRSVVRPGPGNPHAVAGNRFFQPVSTVAATTYVKSRKKRKK